MKYFLLHFFYHFKKFNNFIYTGDKLAGFVVAGRLLVAAGAGDGCQAPPGVVCVATGVAQGVGFAGEVACRVVFKAAGVAQGVGFAGDQPLAVVAGAAAVARRIAHFGEVAPAVVCVVFGEGVRPTAVFGA